MDSARNGIGMDLAVRNSEEDDIQWEWCWGKEQAGKFSLSFCLLDFTRYLLVLFATSRHFASARGLFVSLACPSVSGLE